MSFNVQIITPERSLPPTVADHVTLPAFDGDVGIRTNHAPFVALLGTGRLYIKSATQADRVLALRGGVAQVANNDLKILAESVVEVAEVSENKLVQRLVALNAADYQDATVLAEARVEAHWLATQLKVAGKQVPDLSRLGL